MRGVAAISSVGLVSTLGGIDTVLCAVTAIT